MLLSKNQGRPFITMKDTKTFALTFLALTLALPQAGAGVPLSRPLAELKLSGGVLLPGWQEPAPGRWELWIPDREQAVDDSP